MTTTVKFRLYAPVLCAMWAGATLALWSPVARAQEAGEQAKERPPQIEEIVVTARAGEESIRDVPVAITAVGEERMNQYSIESMMDLEALTPQLSIGRATSGSGTAIAIRGIFSTPSSIGIEQSVAVIIDGVYFPQGRTINEGLFDTKLVSVLKGPQALYFGKNATAGVISVETNDPGDEFEAMLRVNNEFETDDLTLEAMISVPVNEKLGLRLAVQGSDMDEGWIKNNSSPGGDSYGTIDSFGFGLDFWDNPRAVDFFPKEETFYARLTAAGELSETFSYNVKGSYSKFEQGYTGGGELFDCPTLGGIAHTSQPVVPQPPGRQTPLFAPIPLPAVDCGFDGSRGWNNAPPGIAAVNPLLDQFGNGKAGEEYESWIVTASLNWTFENFDVSAVLNWHDQNMQWVGDQDGGEVTSIFAGEENKFKNLSAEFRAVTTFDQPVNFVLGAYYQDTNIWFDQDVIFAFFPIPGVGVFGPRNSDPSIPNPDDEFTAYNKKSETDGETESVYGEVVWDINDRWQLTAGVRYHHETKDSYFIQPYVHPFVTGLFIPHDPSNPATRPDFDQTFKKWIPEATLKWELTDDITAYAAYKEGFKSGGFSNSAILSNLSPPGFFDFIFDPETVHGGEVGVKAVLFDNTVRTSFEVFHYRFKDLQVDFFNSQQFAFVTENAGGSEVEGWEWQVDWATPVEGLTLSGSIGYLSSEFTDFENFCYVGQTPGQGCGPLLPGQNEADLRQNLDGNTRPGAPDWSGFVAANYERQITKNLVFGVSANVQFKSETVLSSSNPTATYESFRTYDANIRLSTVDGKWRLAFIAKNWSDELVIRGAGNVPGTGGNTGTAQGFGGDLSGGAIRGRQLELELTRYF
jgi:outer membrane receptor protein involved in Fe transport